MSPALSPRLTRSEARSFECHIFIQIFLNLLASLAIFAFVCEVILHLKIHSEHWLRHFSIQSTKLFRSQVVYNYRRQIQTCRTLRLLKASSVDRAGWHVNAQIGNVGPVTVAVDPTASKLKKDQGLSITLLIDSAYPPCTVSSLFMYHRGFCPWLRLITRIWLWS